uniref:translin-associated protein X-like n=1 Tax=Styela clava TaxID=7725 RepID=UPI00193A8E4F|nr:translin-associated protein X-like [Styela clava]
MDVIDQFQLFQQELETKHNKWEKIVKLSRDITIDSKKLIFLLHRIDITSPETNSKFKIITEADEKCDIIMKKWKQIATELQDEDSHAYIRAFSPGLQEFIEAMSFLYYFKTEENYSIQSISNCLLDLSEIQKSLVFADDENKEPLVIPIPVLEYLYGIADTTGEVMRLCINSAAKAITETSKKKVFKLCAFIRILYEMFLSFSSIIDVSPGRKRLLQSKIDVMKLSLQKVEDTCYQLGLRGKELLDVILKNYEPIKVNEPSG